LLERAPSDERVLFAEFTTAGLLRSARNDGRRLYQSSSRSCALPGAKSQVSFGCREIFDHELRAPSLQVARRAFSCAPDLPIVRALFRPMVRLAASAFGVSSDRDYSLTTLALAASTLSGGDAKSRYVAGPKVFVCRDCVDMMVDIFSENDHQWADTKARDIAEIRSRPEITR
jgi:hypothetical protein